MQFISKGALKNMSIQQYVSDIFAQTTVGDSQPAIRSLHLPSAWKQNLQQLKSMKRTSRAHQLWILNDALQYFGLGRLQTDCWSWLSALLQVSSHRDNTSSRIFIVSVCVSCSNKTFMLRITQGCKLTFMYESLLFLWICTACLVYPFTVCTCIVCLTGLQYVSRFIQVFVSNVYPSIA